MNDAFLSKFDKCDDTSDCAEISATSGLYLKPIAKLNITVTGPILKPGQIVSNFEIIDKLKYAIKPEKFVSIKFNKKSPIQFLRFDAELEQRLLEFIIGKIDQKGIKIGNSEDILKITASPAKMGTAKNEWESFFKESKGMNENNPGERADTVHLMGLPRPWFAHKEDPDKKTPSEWVLWKVFNSFGDIRGVDIPSLDQYRHQMTPNISGLSKFSPHDQKYFFDAFIQFKEYFQFFKCITALQTHKLVYKKDNGAWYASVTVDFDRTKHMSDGLIKQREWERQKLYAKEYNVPFNEKFPKKESSTKQSKEKHVTEYKDKADKRRAKEERKKEKEFQKMLKKLLNKYESLNDVDDVEDRLRIVISNEKEKVIRIQRKLQASRILDKLFDKIKVYHCQEEIILAAHPSGNKTLADCVTGWFEGKCRKISEKRKSTQEKFSSFKSSKTIQFLYREYDFKLLKTVSDHKKKFLKTCSKRANGKTFDTSAREEEAVKIKRSVKSTKANFHRQYQVAVKKHDKVTQGKIHVRFERVGEENTIDMYPASSGSTSSDSDSSDSSDSVMKKFSGKMKADQIEERSDFYASINQNFNMYPKRGRGRYFRSFAPRGRGNFEGNRGKNAKQPQFPFPYEKVDSSKSNGEFFFCRKTFDHPIKEGKEKWFKRGNEEAEAEKSDSYSRSRSRSRRSSGSRSRSRSRRRSRSYSSRSRSRSRRRSRSSKSRSRSRSRSRSNKSKSRSRSRSKRRSRSRSPRSKSRDRSRSRSRSKSRSRSRRRSLSSRSRSKSKGRRTSSRSRSRSRSRDKKYKSSSKHQYNYDEPEYHRYNEEDNSFRHKQYRGRGRGFQHGPRNTWRGRGRGFKKSNYNNRDDSYSAEGASLYDKYFDSGSKGKSYKDDYYYDDQEYQDGKPYKRNHNDSSVQLYSSKRQKMLNGKKKKSKSSYSSDEGSDFENKKRQKLIKKFDELMDIEEVRESTGLSTSMNDRFREEAERQKMMNKQSSARVNRPDGDRQVIISDSDDDYLPSLPKNYIKKSRNS